MSIAKIKIGVIFGGKYEHEGSIEAAADVVKCLKAHPKYEVIPVYISKEGAWLFFKDGMQLPIACSRSEVNLLVDPERKGFISVASEKVAFSPVDFIFPLVMSFCGEDGSLPGLCKLANIPCAGSGILGSALGLDKIAFKMMLESQNIPTSPYCYTTRLEWHTDPKAIFRRCKESLRLPWFVKPANLGSSLGITKVNHYDEFTAAMEAASGYDHRILIEQGVLSPLEIEVAVIGNEFPSVSCPGQLQFESPFFDYHTKYRPQSTQIFIPPRDLPGDIQETLKGYALKVFRLIGCYGYARVDFLLQDPDLAIFVSELNTVPGLPKNRMFPQLLMHAGFAYEEILDKIISLGFEMHRAF